MESLEYLRLIRSVYDEVIDNFQTSVDKKIFEKIFSECVDVLLQNQNADYFQIFDAMSSDYLKSVDAISKLSPGFATGLKDIKYGITLNTYKGKMSDVPCDGDISGQTVFDASSITKMFTALLLLKEEEKGNIDLSKKFSDYSDLLSKIDIPIIDALKFGVNLKTDGRVDDFSLSSKERIRRLLNTSVINRNTFIYSDIPYMFVTLLFGDNLQNATEKYLKKFYELYRDELGLLQTGYSTINMTGGRIDTKIDYQNNRFIYVKDGVYDPKANIFEKEIGYVSGHAGVTTNVQDLEKIFDSLSNGFLNDESFNKLITTVQPESKILLDENDRPVLSNGKPIYLEHAMGVYVNTGSVEISDVPARYSDRAFAAVGSTGTYSVFDLDNGLNAIFLSNVRSGLYSKIINTEDYVYGYKSDELSRYYETTVRSGTGTFKDGSLLKKDGTFMPYTMVTNNFKEESLDALLKLRIAKEVLIKSAYLEYSGEELCVALEHIDQAFNRNDNVKIKKYQK